MPKTQKGRNKAPKIISTSSSGLPKWKQSPVDLKKIHTWSENFGPLMLTGHWLGEGVATMTNTGQTVKIELANRSLPSIRGGPLKDDDYQFDNLQFRWGPSNCRGAEHSINNFWYSMEAQAVHWNTRYGTIDKCYEKPDGIAILAFFLQVVSCPETPDNPFLADITDYLPKVKKAGTSVSIAPDCLRWILDTCLIGTGYYTYAGSMTTPPYNECVTWMVVPRATKISSRQVDAFRSIYDNKWKHIVRNYRSQHALNGRRVLYATSDHIAGLTKTGRSPINLDDSAVRVKKFPPLILNGHWLNDGEAVLSNNGETATVNLTGNRIPSTIAGGPLSSDVYEFNDAHFHWGKENCNGSEHQINGTWFSMEAHIVHWNRRYRTFDECLKHRDGICVLAYFFLVTEKDLTGNNPQVDKITDNLKYIVNPDSERNIPANALCWMRNATRCPSYYTYSGSYNKGSCPECATWIVFPLIIPISSCQTAEFRKLRDHTGAPVTENCRDIQPPNGRRIFLASTDP